MGLANAPTRHQIAFQFVDQNGHLTPGAARHIDEMWRHVGAGYMIVPCTATGTNVITLSPTLSGEGAKLYNTGMVFSARAANTSTGAVTALVTYKTALATVKVYKSPGIVQAAAGDIVQFGIYLFVYNALLDGGNGGFVLK